MPSETAWHSSSIQKRPMVCGGSACIRDTRIPVWSIVRARQLGVSDAALQSYFVTPLTASDVQAAVEYYAAHSGEIDNEIRLNEEA